MYSTTNAITFGGENIVGMCGKNLGNACCKKFFKKFHNGYHIPAQITGIR